MFAFAASAYTPKIDWPEYFLTNSGTDTTVSTSDVHTLQDPPVNRIVNIWVLAETAATSLSGESVTSIVVNGVTATLHTASLSQNGYLLVQPASVRLPDGDKSFQVTINWTTGASKLVYITSAVTNNCSSDTVSAIYLGQDSTPTSWLINTTYTTYREMLAFCCNRGSSVPAPESLYMFGSASSWNTQVGIDTPTSNLTYMKLYVGRIATLAGSDSVYFTGVATDSIVSLQYVNRLDNTVSP